MAKTYIKIKTPDQRLRVFVSSTLRELAEERKAARAAIESIHLIPVMFELGARPHPPKDLYRAYLEQSNIFIGIYWQSYGWIAENEKISGLEDELLLSEKYPGLIYVKEPAPAREEKLNTMLDYIRSRGNVSYKSFTTTDELSDYIENDLAILISERFTSHEELSERKKSVHNNLPVHYSQLIGREKEVTEIRDLVLNKDLHLITITGAGGIGKTKLSIAVGKSLENCFEDGIYFADLSGVFNENNIFTELASIFGISLNTKLDMAMQIADYISDQKILLIVDNFEQLTFAGSKLSAIVERCPNLYVIVTSRNLLELSLEKEYNLDSLDYPDPSFDLNEIEISPSVRLFCERARSADKNFELNEENIYIVSEICRMLGGLPLAIILAAVKVRMFSLKVIKDRLSEKLDFLSGGMKDSPSRHKTMKAAIEWSYDLLNEEEKKLFRRLSVFVSGFDLEAIENICCFDMDDPYGTIESLITKNFLRKESEAGGIVNFRMLDLLQKYSGELFDQSGENETIKAVLADFYLKKVREESSKYYGAIEAKINSDWENNIRNVMNGLETLNKQKRYTELIEMIYALWPVFWIFNHDKILEKSIDLNIILQIDDGLTDELRGKLNWLGGSAAMETGDLETAASRFQNANRFFTLTENIRGIAWTNLILNSLKNSSENEFSSESVINGFTKSAGLFRTCGDQWGESVAMQYISAFEMTTGNYMKAVEDYDACIKLLKKMDSPSLEGYITSLKALAYIEMDQFDKASELLKKATAILKIKKIDEAVAYSLIIISYYYFRINEYEKAMFVAGFCKNIFSKYNFVPWHMLSSLFRYIDIHVKSFNDDEKYSAEYNRGMKVNIFKAGETAFKAMNNEQ